MSKRKIVDARADSDGVIESVRFEGNSNFTSVERAIPMAERGEIANTHVVRARDKRPHLRTNPDRSTKNNLDELADDH